MASLEKAVRAFFAGASILLLFACVLVLLTLFVLDPGLRANAEAVIKLLAALIPGAAIAAFVFRGLARRVRQRGTASHALSAWLAEEWLLQLLVWVFVVFELVALSYFAPVYALRLSVGGDSEVPLSGPIRVASSPGDVPFEREKLDSGVLLFRSARTFRWGDSALIHIRGAEGYSDDSLVVPWSGFAVFHLLGSVPLPQVRLHPSEVQLTIFTDPAQAKITVYGPLGSATFASPRALREPRNASLKVSVTAPNHIPVDTVVLMRDDATVYIRLAPVHGRLRVRAFNDGGEEEIGMQVIVNDMDDHHETPQVMDLAPGTYRVRLEKRAPDRLVFAGPFTFTVHSGVLTECRVVTAVRTPGTPTPPRGGRVSGCQP